MLMYSLKLTVGLKKCQKFKTALPHCTYNAVFCKVQTRLKCNFSEFNKRYNYLQTRSLKKKQEKFRIGTIQNTWAPLTLTNFRRIEFSDITGIRLSSELEKFIHNQNQNFAAYFAFQAHFGLWVFHLLPIRFVSS